MSELVGVVPKFEPTDEQWGDYERILNKPLNEKCRAEIKRLVDEFYKLSSFALNAVLVDDKIQELRQIKENAAALRNCLMPGRGPAAADAKLHLSSFLKKTRSDNSDPVAFLQSYLNDLSQSCALAIGDAQNSEGWELFDYWDRLIYALREYLKKIGVHTTIPKHGRSVFIDFVCSLQADFPDNMPKRGQQSSAALATAIGRALKRVQAAIVEETLAERPTGTFS